MNYLKKEWFKMADQIENGLCKLLKIKEVKILQYLVSIFFMLAGVICAFTYTIIGIILVILALLIFPLISNILEKKINIKYFEIAKFASIFTVFVFLILSIVLTASNIKEKEIKNADNIVEQAEQKIDSLKIDDAYELLSSVKYVYDNLDNKASRLMKEIEYFRDNAKKTLIEMSDEEFNKLKAKALNKTYLTQKTLNTKFIDTLYSLANKRNEFIAEFELKKLEEKIEKQQKEREKKIESQFSKYDGSHINLEKYIKNNMNDPDSYEHVETVYTDKGKFISVKTKFRGNNAFGGKVINIIVAKVDIDGNIIEAVQL